MSDVFEFCINGFHLDVLSALQQPFVEIPGVFILFLLDLKVDVGLPQYLKPPERRASRVSYTVQCFYSDTQHFL